MADDDGESKKKSGGGGGRYALWGVFTLLRFWRIFGRGGRYVSRSADSGRPWWLLLPILGGIVLLGYAIRGLRRPEKLSEEGESSSWVRTKHALLLVVALALIALPLWGFVSWRP